MSIVREPATGIPKIPGTSLAGAVRAYAEFAKAEDNSLPDIDLVFGTTEKQGMVRFYDGDIALFPISSNLGTVWVTTSDRLRNWFSDCSPGGDPIQLPAELQDESKVVVLKGFDSTTPIHLGWLLLETETLGRAGSIVRLPPPLVFVKRLVAVSDKLFHHLVNDHLEVRTSVSIDDATGAAKEGALFTYEAMPRATVIGFEVGIDTRRGGGIPDAEVDQLLRKAFDALKLLGVGGMGTRGFGRLEVLDRGEAARRGNAAQGDQS